MAPWVEKLSPQALFLSYCIAYHSVMQLYRNEPGAGPVHVELEETTRIRKSLMDGE
jgi:hypothetical protein